MSQQLELDHKSRENLMEGLHTLRPFALERFFARHEFSAPYLLCCSDTQPLQLSELMDLADEDIRARWEGLSLGYTESQGLPALREAIAASPSLYTSISPQEVIVCAPQEGVYLCMLAMLRPGDRVVVTHPGYQSLHEVARALGCQLALWEVESSPTGRLQFSVDTLEGLLEGEGEGSTRLVVVNFPHNPTGWLPSHQEWRRVVEACRRAGAYLFSDEMYRGMEFDPGSRLASAVDCYQRGVSLCGMSKAVGLPGLRIGWLATHDAEVLRRVAELKDYTTICSSAPSEMLALMGVRAWDSLLRRQMRIITQNLTLVEAWARRWEGVVEWSAPMAGSIAFPRLLTGEYVDVFCEELVAGAGVLLLPATVYDHAPSIEQGRFRLRLGRNNLAQCLQRLEGFMERRYSQPAERVAGKLGKSGFEDGQPQRERWSGCASQGV